MACRNAWLSEGPVSGALLTGAGLIWLLGAALVLRRQYQPHAGLARLMLVLTGVPLLGLATYQFGPLAGVAGLLIGAGVLLKCRLPRFGGAERDPAPRPDPALSMLKDELP